MSKASIMQRKKKVIKNRSSQTYHGRDANANLCLAMKMAVINPCVNSVENALQNDKKKKRQITRVMTALAT